MAGLPWIRLDVDIFTHPKAIALSAALGEENAWAWVARLWAWAAKHAQDGVIRGENPDAIIEAAVFWRGPPGELAKALRECGWVDVTGNEGNVTGNASVTGCNIHSIHGWGERQGAGIARAASARERVRKHRASVRERNANGNANVRVTFAGNETIRNDDLKALRPPPVAAPAEAPGAGPSPPQAPAPNPRHTPVRERLEAAFRSRRGAAMAWDGAEAKALAALLKRCPDDAEILRRWEAALALKAYPGCNSVASLAQRDRWNALAGTGPPAVHRAIAPVGDFTRPDAAEY